jgi:protein-S-isoprenylcysteine O-methyltransferase Ste14
MAMIPTAAELASIQRAGLLLGPAVAAFLLLRASRPNARAATAAMVAFLWQLPALLLLQVAATTFGWWRFDAPQDALLGLPVDVWIGWALWWGPVAVFAGRWLSIPWLVGLSVAVDLVAMPLLVPLIALGPRWWIGDAVATAGCLLPALVFARLTREDRLPKRRAMFHTLGWGGYLVFVLPACVFAFEARGMSALYRLPASPGDALTLLGVVVLLFVGIAATAEFASMGHGTPIPLDPPKHVVTTGPYAFIANPMQVISAAVMLLLAVYARSWGLALIGVMFVLFDTVYATWYNRAHISHAMPREWHGYRDAVDEWRPRWRPHPPGDAHVTISPDGPSRWLWDRAWPWLSRRMTGAIVVDSEPRSRFDRLGYRVPSRGIEEHGLRAAARILEHGPAPVAMVGWLLRFPYLGGALQRLTSLVVALWRRWTGSASHP